MSRRFGRQQKRKMRAQIAELESQLAQSQGWVNHHKEAADLLRSRNYKLERAINLTARVLGDRFIALPPQEIPVRSVEPYFRVPMAPQFVPEFLTHASPEEYCHRIQDLKTTMVSAELDQFRSCIHVALRTPAGEYRYATTLEALATMPEPYLIEHLAEQFAKTIATSQQMKACLKELQSNGRQRK